MSFQSYAVACTMFEELFKPCFADLIQAFVVHFFRNGTFFQVLRRSVVGREHGVEKALGIIGWLPDGERALALHAVAAQLCAKTQNQGIASFKPFFARHGMGKSGALAKEIGRAS